MRPYFGAFGAFVSAIALTVATAQTPAAQQKTAPPGPAPKKNPLLKLAEPWPEADVLNQRKKDAEERPLFKSTDPLEFTAPAWAFGQHDSWYEAGSELADLCHQATTVDGHTVTLEVPAGGVRILELK